MSTFDKRKEGREGRFALDAELKFKATARRDRALGEYIAGLLGKTGDDATAYADSLIKANLAEPGDQDLYRKVRADLDEAGVDLSDHLLEKKSEELMAQAIEEIEAGK